uniref:Uncharacterized protein n=1 Tax=Amphimedon queenslandica TaxID=400682 RepID=A0A1X7SQE0_AMPQE
MTLEKSAPMSASSYYAVATKLSPQAEAKLHTTEAEEEVVLALIDLKKEFNFLMMHVRSGLQIKISKDPKQLKNLIIWLETYMHWNDKLTNASLDEIFKAIDPFYDYIDCNLIVDISEKFLQDFKIGDSELNIVSELKDYQKKADKLKSSAQVKHLIEASKYEGFIETCKSTLNMSVMVLHVVSEWRSISINRLFQLIHNLFPAGHQPSIMKYTTVEEGSVIITMHIPDYIAESLIEYTRGKLQFMPLVGIFSLCITAHNVLQKDEDMNFTFERALLEAVTAGNNEAVEFLLQLETVNIDHTNEEGRTALMLACERGHEDIVHSLLSAGADVNIQDNEGWTALMIASKCNHISIIHMLLQANANPHLKTSDGSNAVMIASYHGNYEVVELLISKGVDYKCQREDGMNAFILACQNGHTQVVELLPREKVDPNIQNGEGITPLMIGNAAEYEVVSERIADPSTRCSEGNSLAETAKLNLAEA